MLALRLSFNLHLLAVLAFASSFIYNASSWGYALPSAIAIAFVILLMIAQFFSKVFFLLLAVPVLIVFVCLEIWAALSCIGCAGYLCGGCVFIVPVAGYCFLFIIRLSFRIRGIMSLSFWEWPRSGA